MTQGDQAAPGDNFRPETNRRRDGAIAVGRSERDFRGLFESPTIQSRFKHRPTAACHEEQLSRQSPICPSGSPITREGASSTARVPCHQSAVLRRYITRARDSRRYPRFASAERHLSAFHLPDVSSRWPPSDRRGPMLEFEFVTRFPRAGNDGNRNSIVFQASIGLRMVRIRISGPSLTLSPAWSR
jgi:hypothetical protein